MPVPAATTAENDELSKQLYNAIMVNIEPDLVLEHLPYLDELYAGESEADRAERMARYEAAYKKFDEEFQNFMGEVHEEVRSSRREALKAKEIRDRAEEQTQLTNLETAFN